MLSKFKFIFIFIEVKSAKHAIILKHTVQLWGCVCDGTMLKCLFCERKYLNSIPEHMYRGEKKPVMVTHTCSPSTEEAETSGSLGLPGQSA